MPRMTAARAAVEILRREGVTHLFGLPGAAVNPFYAVPVVVEFDELDDVRHPVPTASGPRE